MRRTPFLALIVACTLAIPAHANADTLTVFAAASLREALSELGPSFTKATGTAVTFNFAGSDALATQIMQGAPADVFASANEPQMVRVADAKLLAAPAGTLVRNRIVVAVPLSNRAGVTGAASLANPGLKVVLAAPTVPVGKYARDAFATMAKNPSFPPDFAARVEKNVISNETDVKAVATKIALDEADAGVIYETDVTGDIRPRVKTFPIAGEFAKPAVYPIAAIHGSREEAARTFIAFLRSPAAQAVFAKAGFLTAQP